MAKQKDQFLMQLPTLIFIIAVAFISHPVFAQSNAILSKAVLCDCVLSEARNNIVIGFRNPERGTPNHKTANSIVFSSDSPIFFGFGSLSKTPYDVLSFDKEYGYIISAKATNGKEIEKTFEGRKYGSRINDGIGWNQSQFDKSEGQGNSKGSPYRNVAMISGINFSRHLPALDRLFKFKEPGEYLVSIQIQCLVGPYGAANPTNVNIVRLPSVTLHVNKT